MKVILIISKAEAYSGCDSIVGVASTMQNVDLLLGKMAREGKIFGTFTNFHFWEVEVDVDVTAHWERKLGREMLEAAKKTVQEEK